MFWSARHLSAGSANWEAIRDQEVRKAELESEIELRRLEEERKLFEARQAQVGAELDRLGESEANLRAHRAIARWWLALFLLALGVAVGSAWWSVNWYLTLTWEKALLALTLFVLPLVGWMAFLIYARDRAQGRDLWRVFCGLGLLVVVCSVLATALLGAGRMAGTALEEERRQTEASRTDGELGSSSDAPLSNSQVSQVSRVKNLLSFFTMAAVILLGVAGEVAAGLAFHEYYKHMTVVWTVWPFYREQRRLGALLVENSRGQDEVRRWPELVHVRLTAQALREEARADSLSLLIRRVFLVVGVGLVLLLVVAGLVFAEELPRQITVVVLDTSTSAAADEEFSKNLRAIEGVAERIGAGGSRLVVLGVTEASFGLAPLLVETSPRAAGRFGEYVDEWRRTVVQAWRKVAGALKPSARGSDLFGALARASIEFDEVPKGPKRLIVLSDMRQVGRGFNFERIMGDSQAVVQEVERQNLIPRLDGVQVWLLGVHTVGIDERHWGRIKAFWTEYFRRAGAELKAFTPSRRLDER